MHPQHKTVKVQALFPLSRQALIEKVHQPGFPASYTAPHI
ncbi:Uncharacterised protein [Shigella sonnei]|nr:Uncharacterised protein [Shigella sonnei]